VRVKWGKETLARAVALASKKPDGARLSEPHTVVRQMCKCCGAVVIDTDAHVRATVEKAYGEAEQLCRGSAVGWFEPVPEDDMTPVGEQAYAWRVYQVGQEQAHLERVVALGDVPGDIKAEVHVIWGQWVQARICAAGFQRGECSRVDFWEGKEYRSLECDASIRAELARLSEGYCKELLEAMWL